MTVGDGVANNTLQQTDAKAMETLTHDSLKGADSQEKLSTFKGRSKSTINPDA